MAFFLTQILGDGSDAEGNQFRPAIAKYTETWRCIADGRANSALGSGLMLVEADHLPAFDADAAISLIAGKTALTTVNLSDESEKDEKEVARKICKRFWLRQVLRADDFPSGLAIGDITAARRQRISAALTARGIDVSTLKAGMTVLDALQSVILPQVRIAFDPEPPSPTGTFTDTFTDTDGTALESHTPSGGTAWTRVDGVAGDAAINSNQLRSTGTDTLGAAYRCDTQGQAAHYTQWVVVSLGAGGLTGAFVCNRITDRSNYIGARVLTPGGTALYQIFKRNAGTFSQLGSNSATTAVAGDVAKLESSAADAHTLYQNGSAVVGPVTDAFNNTQVRQGINVRSKIENVIDTFEAGALVTNAIGAGLVRSQLLHSPLLGRLIR
jgi:hypothetical protein